jgi:hypothetical protein
MSATTRRRAGRSTGVLIAITLAGLARPALAQHAGLPVHLSPVHARVVGAYADFGTSGGWAGSERLDRIGGRLRLTTPRLQIVAGAGRVSSGAVDLDAGLSLGGVFAYSFGQRTTTRWSAFGGAGWTDLDGAPGSSLQQLDAPAGIGVGLHAPAPIGVFEGWGAARVHLRSSLRTALDTGERVTRVGGGLSAGLSYTHPRSQLGVGLSGDALVIDDPARGGVRVTAAFGVSLHYLRMSR